MWRQGVERPRPSGKDSFSESEERLGERTVHFYEIIIQIPARYIPG